MTILSLCVTQDNGAGGVGCIGTKQLEIPAPEESRKREHAALYGNAGLYVTETPVDAE